MRTPADPSLLGRLAFRCFGCSFVDAALASPVAPAEVRSELTRLGIAIVLAMNVMVFTIALWTKDLYVEPADHRSLAAAMFSLFRYLTLLFASGVLVLLGEPIAAALHRRPRQRSHHHGPVDSHRHRFGLRLFGAVDAPRLGAYLL